MFFGVEYVGVLRYYELRFGRKIGVFFRKGGIEDINLYWVFLEVIRFVRVSGCFF